MVALFLYNKDLQKITGKSRMSCWRYMNYIRSVVGKQKHQRITIYDLQKVEGLSMEEIQHALSGKQLKIF